MKSLITGLRPNFLSNLKNEYNAAVPSTIMPMAYLTGPLRKYDRINTVVISDKLIANVLIVSFAYIKLYFLWAKKRVIVKPNI